MKPYLPLLAAVLLMQLLQCFQLAAMPGAFMAAQAQAMQAARQQAQAEKNAALMADMASEETQRKQQQQVFEQQALEAALARIPADVPEPQRTTAAKELLRIDLEEPRPGETPAAFQSRLAVRRALMSARGY